MKTFCFFSTQYLPTMGGVERYTYNLATRLRAAGHRVLVVTAALPNLPSRETDENGTEIFRLPSYLLMGGRFPVIRKNMACKQLCAQLWACKPDFCVINTYFYPASLYAARMSKKLGIPALLIDHGSAWLMPGHGPIALAARLYERFAAHRAHRLCPDFYGVSQACCDFMQTKFGIQALGCLENAVDLDELTRLAAQAQVDWRAELGLADDTPLIAYAGRLIPEKGVLPLAETLPQIRNSIPAASIIMLGDGALLPQLRAMQQPGLYLPGTQSYARTLALFAQADVFCLPSRSEGFACTVLEAAALRCPIITTATGGSPQLLRDATYGTLLPDADPDTLASACTAALENPAWRTTAADKTLACLRENYTWDKISTRLLEIAQRSFG